MSISKPRPSGHLSVDGEACCEEAGSRGASGSAGMSAQEANRWFVKARGAYRKRHLEQLKADAAQDSKGHERPDPASGLRQTPRGGFLRAFSDINLEPRERPREARPGEQPTTDPPWVMFRSSFSTFAKRLQLLTARLVCALARRMRHATTPLSTKRVVEKRVAVAAKQQSKKRVDDSSIGRR